jgi:hypothetical protein
MISGVSDRPALAHTGMGLIFAGKRKRPPLALSLRSSSGAGCSRPRLRCSSSSCATVLQLFGIRLAAGLGDDLALGRDHDRVGHAPTA